MMLLCGDCSGKGWFCDRENDDEITECENCLGDGLVERGRDLSLLVKKFNNKTNERDSDERN